MLRCSDSKIPLGGRGGGGGGGGTAEKQDQEHDGEGHRDRNRDREGELTARVALLRALSDLREGLWAFAHGTSLGPLDATTRDAVTVEGLPPPSFYVGYGLRCLDRFRGAVAD